MPHMLFTGEHRFDEFAAWEQEMRRCAAGFSVLTYHTIPATDGEPGSLDIEYALPVGSDRPYSRCIICGEFLLGRELPKESPVFTISGRRLGT